MKQYVCTSLVMAVLLASSEGLGVSAARDREKPRKPLSDYTVISVEKFTVGTLPTEEGFPQYFEEVMHKAAVEKLTASKLFENVIDVSEASTVPSSSASADERGQRIILSAAVIGYDPGSRAARAWIGLGAGAAKIKVRFVFRDAQNNEEVFRSDLQGKFTGTWSITGGATEKATRESAGKVVEELIKEIRRNR